MRPAHVHIQGTGETKLDELEADARGVDPTVLVPVRDGQGVSSRTELEACDTVWCAYWK